MDQVITVLNYKWEETICLYGGKMEAGKRSINDIFNGNKILEIPFFQRSYVWDEPQWKDFYQTWNLYR